MKIKYIILLLAAPMLGKSQIRDNAGASGTEGAVSGFFETYNPVNYPAGAAGWWHLLDVRHTNINNNYAMQFSGSFYDQNLYFRKTDNSGARPWLRVITEEAGIVRIPKLTIVNPGSSINAGNIGMTTGDFIIQANTGGRFADKGAQLEFAIPADQNGDNLWGQGRILTVAGSADNHNAIGKMIIGTRRMFNKIGTGPEWYYGDDLVIDGVGNIGVGTLLPKEKLSVNGKIRAHEIQVEASNWPDFVFEQKYPLMPLHELESYISKNGHLPQTPSAKEIDANGLSLGEMVKLQQQKIEELSLYIIKQEKRLNDQELRASQQLKLNEKLFDNILSLKKEIKKRR